MVTKKIDYWLDEKDLKTPEHDALVIKTFKNAEKIINKIDNISDMFCECYYPHDNYYRNTVEWDWERKEVVSGDHAGFVKKDYINFCEQLEKKEDIIITKRLEFNLKEFDRYSVGFIDLLCILPFQPIETDYFSERYNPKINKKENPRKFDEGYRFYYAFEIKPKLDSMGNILRQISHYRTALPDTTRMILVTNDEVNKEIYKSQNIHVFSSKEIDELEG